MDTDVILKRFEHPDEVRTFDKGKFELVRPAYDVVRPSGGV